MTPSITPFFLKDAPALIERLLPVQKLSAEAYKEQMAHIGKSLTALGSYWKGRKPLILNKACILGCLLPATNDLKRDLEIFEKLMASRKANQARLKSAVEFGKTEMSDSSELYQSVLRAVLYAMMELVKNVDGNAVLRHLTQNVHDYYANQTQRDLVVQLANYLAKKLETSHPEEASAARILRELVKNQRLG